MWKLLIVALAAITALVGCQDERNNFMVDDSISFVSADVAGVSVYNEGYKLAILKNGKGQQSASASVAIATEAALANYNTANGTNYVAMPTNCYKLAATNVSFSEKEIRKYIDITWNAGDVTTLDSDKNYVIAVKLSVDNGALNIDANRNILIIHPKLSAVSMKDEKVSPMKPKASREEVIYEGSVLLDVPVEATEIKVSLSVDNSLIEDYNAANSTTYKAAPEGFATLAAQEVVIAAGQTGTTFTCKLNSAKLFTGNALNSADDLLVPIRITSTSVDGIGIESAITYIPITKNGVLKGPWKLLEGENNCYGKDPNAPGWALGYTADKLFDGILTAGGEWISSWDYGPLKFPLTFVADMGEARVFTNFKISDYTTHQGQYRNYEIYTAEEYDGENTKWNLVAKGMRGYSWAAVPPPYDFPVQAMAAGRYLKFMIMKPEYSVTSVDYLNGRGKLADVQGIGF